MSTFGAIISNRSFFPDHLVRTAREKLMAAMEQWGHQVIALAPEDGTDFAARWEHLRQANQHLIDNAVVIPLEQEVKGYLVNPALEGYVTHQLGNSVFDLTRAYFAD